MLYAYPQGWTGPPDPSKRIRADEHQGAMGVCPLHGCTVMSRVRNGIWQWVHVKKPLISEMKEALAMMLQTHGMHGPCSHNNCRTCDTAYKSAKKALERAEGENHVPH